MNALYLLEQLQKNNIDIEAFRFNQDTVFDEMVKQIKKCGGYLATEYKINHEKKAMDVDFVFHQAELPKMPTQYQDLVCYCAFEKPLQVLFSVLPHFKDQWKNILQISDISRENVKFGTIANPKFNSAAYKVNELEYLIVINEGVLSMLNEMSTIMVEFLFEDDLIRYDILLNNLNTKPDVIKEFILKMLAYHLFNYTWWGQKKKEKESELFWSIRDALAYESRMFVCAHELGHILLGHFEKDEETKALWEEEYQADQFAALIMFCEENIHPVFPSVASAMVLSILECMDRLNGNFVNKRRTQHPLSYERVNKVGGTAFKSLGYEASTPFQLTRMLINILWEELMDFVVYLWKQKGIDLEKNNFEEIQKILDREYTLPDRDYENYLNNCIYSGYSNVRGFYNPEYGFEEDS